MVKKGQALLLLTEGKCRIPHLTQTCTGCNGTQNREPEEESPSGDWSEPGHWSKC